MAEQIIVEKIRKILTKEKCYPDPANCASPDENGLVLYAQDDYKKNTELKELFKHASKCGKKNQERLWTNQASDGRPEFTIINYNSNLAIVIECKPAQKSQNHISFFLRDNNKLLGNADYIEKYAVDGALHYAKFLSKKYDVIAIGVSGILNSEELNISTYYWEKGKKVFEDIASINNKEYTACHGPFVNLKLNTLQSFIWYKNFIENESKKIIKNYGESQATKSASELNVMLDGAGVNPIERALLVSGLLLALRDKTFQTTYEDKEITAKDLQSNLNNAIDRIISNEDIQDDFKKQVLKDKFKDTFNQQDLLSNNAEKLRLVLDKLHKEVYYYMTGEYSLDIIGKFYHEFLSYAPSSQNNGIKLTPSQITELFCDLADLKVTDKILDPCLGTAGFLIAGMNRLYSLADKMNEFDIEEYFREKLETNEIDTKTIEKYKKENKKLNGYETLNVSNVKQHIRKTQLTGCESDKIMYTLGCSNMILRGDGKSNILLGDCFNKQTELKKFNATVGMMNPPYSESAYSVMQFVQLLCKSVKKGSKVIAIVPTSAAHSEDYLDIRNKILEDNKLLGVISTSEELFKGIAGAITCIMILEAGIKHNFGDTVYFGNWKEDGYYWSKSLNLMIPDVERIRYAKTPDEYKEEWLKSYRNKNIDDAYGCWKKLTKTKVEKNEICLDEWLWEYFVETDYSKLNADDFKKHVQDFILFNLSQLSLEKDLEE